jgi:signal transduction histidine kinase
VIESDATRVRQILGNLFSNAVKYTDEGEVRAFVELRSGDGAHGKAGEWIAAAVVDTGPGIPAEKHRLLFQEFTRLDPGEKKGAGVGLAISQRIAHALGGEITAESEAGAGSTFTLWLPCTRGVTGAEHGG